MIAVTREPQNYTPTIITIGTQKELDKLTACLAALNLWPEIAGLAKQLSPHCSEKFAEYYGFLMAKIERKK